MRKLKKWIAAIGAVALGLTSVFGGAVSANAAEEELILGSDYSFVRLYSKNYNTTEPNDIGGMFNDTGMTLNRDNSPYYVAYAVFDISNVQSLTRITRSGSGPMNIYAAKADSLIASTLPTDMTNQQYTDWGDEAKNWRTCPLKSEYELQPINGGQADNAKDILTEIDVSKDPDNNDVDWSQYKYLVLAFRGWSDTTVQNLKIYGTPKETVTWDAAGTGTDAGYYASTASAADKEGIMRFFAKYATADTVTKYGFCIVNESGQFYTNGKIMTEGTPTANAEGAYEMFADITGVPSDATGTMYAKAFVVTANGRVHICDTLLTVAPDFSAKWLGPKA